MTEKRRCPALVIAAPASGHGKTTVTAALVRAYHLLGCRVRVFKTGPDFLDPQILARASDAPVYNLDLWMGGEAHCRELLHRAASEADIILIEGVMGLFDGTSSSADLAQLFGIPVLAVIDASAMAQTFAAIAYGLQHFRKDLPFVGVLANRVGSDSHARILRESLPESTRWFGALSKRDDIALPSRHLGLAQAQEILDLDERIERVARALLEQDCLNRLPEAIAFDAPQPFEVPRHLQNKTIAIARDAAFAFCYPANIDVLHSLGATIEFFSPLADDSVPSADAVYLPGGYPELHAAPLSCAKCFQESLRQHAQANKVIVAECGGMMVLLDTLVTHQNESFAMCGLIPGVSRMRKKLVNLGMHSVDTAQGDLRGHTFHHSEAEITLEPFSYTRSVRASGRGEAVYRHGSIWASYLHLYFASNINAAAAIFEN